MTKIFEALERAAKERGDADEAPVADLPESPKPTDSPVSERGALRSPGEKIQEKLTALYRSISNALPVDATPIVQFVGSHKGEGTTTLVREFAKTVATKLHKRVLLVDADPQGDLLTQLSLSASLGWAQANAEQKTIVDIAQSVGESGLFVSQMCTDGSSITPIVEAGFTAALFEQARAEFELILLDSAPATLAADSVALSVKTDGVVLVVEADKTRWQVANSVKERIESQGGIILGVFLNNRRHYIPRFIYKRL